MNSVKLGLIGDNISESRAPALHRHAARQLDIDLSYDLIIPADEGMNFERCLAKARQAGLAGVNVTLPYKQDAFAQTTIQDDATRRLGAVNTVLFTSSAMLGFNTDHSGFKRAYRQARGDEAAGRVAVIGAGGVGRAIAHALLDLGATQLLVIDTRADHATGLTAKLNSLCPGIGLTTGSDQLQGCDAVINCTPAGMSGYGGLPLPEHCLPETCRWVFDAVYTPVNTPFSTLARSRGVQFISGFDLFFFQGVDAFRLFTGHQVKDEQALRQALINDMAPEEFA